MNKVAKQASRYQHVWAVILREVFVVTCTIRCTDSRRDWYYHRRLPFSETTKSIVTLQNHLQSSTIRKKNPLFICGRSESLKPHLLHMFMSWSLKNTWSWSTEPLYNQVNNENQYLLRTPWQFPQYISDRTYEQIPNMPQMPTYPNSRHLPFAYRTYYKKDTPFCINSKHQGDQKASSPRETMGSANTQ